MADEPRPAGSPRRCPVCGKLAAAAFRPFCSERCRQVDLGRWLSGRYAVPGDPEPDGDGRPQE
ncbi:DNA gyrase inhibitor YacG [Craurococcus roseus]|uniref:DNA gyrase inhibitor YacG n=1 Tax=Craurococcus roseus TaxID=77585 RepID=UPI0031CFAAD2